MTKTLDDFLPYISPAAASAPEPVIERCLRRAATRFCERTKLWRSYAEITTDGTTAVAVAPLPTDAVMHEVIACSIGTLDCDNNIATVRRLHAKSVEDIDRIHPMWRHDPVNEGMAKWYLCPDFGMIQTVPAAPGVLMVDFVAKPSSTAATYPDFLVNLYVETIAGGAAAYVLLMPEDSFANPELGSALNTEFEGKLDSLFAAGRRGQQRAPVRTRGRYF